MGSPWPHLPKLVSSVYPQNVCAPCADRLNLEEAERPCVNRREEVSCRTGAFFVTPRHPLLLPHPNQSASAIPDLGNAFLVPVCDPGLCWKETDWTSPRPPIRDTQHDGDHWVPNP
jgi:hypothetical protein